MFSMFTDTCVLTFVYWNTCVDICLPIQVCWHLFTDTRVLTLFTGTRVLTFVYSHTCVDICLLIHVCWHLFTDTRVVTFVYWYTCVDICILTPCVDICLPIHLCWHLFTAPLKIPTSPHWYFICSFFFSGDNTAVGLTRLFQGQCVTTKKDPNCSPLGYYTPYGKRLSDVSQENAASFLTVKHLPEPKFHPEDEDSMIPETFEQKEQWPKNNI